MLFNIGGEDRSRGSPEPGAITLERKMKPAKRSFPRLGASAKRGGKCRGIRWSSCNNRTPSSSTVHMRKATDATWYISFLSIKWPPLEWFDDSSWCKLEFHAHIYVSRVAVMPMVRLTLHRHMVRLTLHRHLCYSSRIECSAVMPGGWWLGLDKFAVLGWLPQSNLLRTSQSPNRLRRLTQCWIYLWLTTASMTK